MKEEVLSELEVFFREYPEYVEKPKEKKVSNGLLIPVPSSQSKGSMASTPSKKRFNPISEKLEEALLALSK